MHCPEASPLSERHSARLASFNALLTLFGIVSNKDTAENIKQEFGELSINENECQPAPG